MTLLSHAITIAIVAGAAWLCPDDAHSYSGELYVVCDLGSEDQRVPTLDLRACGSASCKAIYRLQAGTFLLSLEPRATSGWREVFVLAGIADRSTSIKGWVPMRRICEIRFPGRRS